MTILHPEPSCNRSELRETKPLVQMSCMNITLYNSVELKDPESDLPALLKAIENQLLSDMLPARLRRNRIAGIAYMAAPSDIIRMKDI